MKRHDEVFCELRLRLFQLTVVGIPVAGLALLLSIGMMAEVLGGVDSSSGFAWFGRTLLGAALLVWLAFLILLGVAWIRAEAAGVWSLRAVQLGVLLAWMAIVLSVLPNTLVAVAWVLGHVDFLFPGVSHG